ncbi:MAG: histidine triad family protein [Chloroflexia bacterium]|jgi:histidine triad (HIT) family protein|nr:histidine triad family protein [Chloroflexia bacterium]
MSDCIFCDIVAGNQPASLVYEDAVAVAFMDIQPVNTGHVLVIPREHFAFLSDMDEETGAHLFKVAMRVQEAIRRSGVRCEGINLFLADGEAAFQEVFHVHLHVFPRYKGDGFKLEEDSSHDPARVELDEVAGRIRETMNDRRW